MNLKTNPESFFHSGNREKDLIQLVDCAYDLVELWQTADQSYNTKLRAAWLKRAKELGAIPSL